MSGFAGVVRLDARPPGDLADRLAAAIAHRGRVSVGAAALGSAPGDRAPGDRAPEGGRAHTVAADIRLDNRDELLALLGGADAAPDDAALIAAAYHRWGADLARHLDGDFAFVLIDRRARTVVCARDAFGVKPLVYALLPGTLFACASEACALMALDEVPRDVDGERIADFLEVRFADHERTFFRSIKRLPGGCTLVLRDGAASVTRWWSPEEIRPAPRASDGEYAEGFRGHFLRAVRTRMRGVRPGEIGAMLSGGLDSSAIACAARDELAGAAPLPVFSWIFSDVPAADEREFQELAAASGGMERHVIDSATSGFSPWSDLERLLPNGPPYAPNHYLNHGMAAVARSRGVRVLLDGLGGDSSISRGGARFIELFVRGRALALARELRAFAGVNGGSAARQFVWQVLAPLAPPPLLWAYRAVRRREQVRAPYPPHLSVRAEHIAHLQSPLLAEGLELFDRVMALAGVEGRYPFFDRRLVEYCVSLPSDQKLAGGYSRVVARRALAGVVPDAVLWRAGKGKPGLHIIPALRAESARLDDVFLRDPSALAPYAGIDALRTLYRAFMEGRKADLLTAVRVWSAATAALWLRGLPQPCLTL